MTHNADNDALPYLDAVLSEQLGMPVIVDNRVPNDAVYILNLGSATRVTPPELSAS